MKIVKLGLLVGLTVVVFSYTRNTAIGNGALCWWVMALMLSLLGADEENYQRRLKSSKTEGLCVSFTWLKFTRIINIDYFKLGCEKAFEWTYVSVLWVTGMSSLFHGLGLVSKAEAMYSFSNIVSSLAGIAWCLPAIAYYFYKKKWFAAHEINKDTTVSNFSRN
jgi:hypothetical protein